MKILKSILSTLLVIFNMVPYEAKKAIFIYLLKKLADNSKNKLDDKLVAQIEKKL